MKPAFDYLEKIKKSLYNFKKILENCFYHLFLPSRLTPKYGIRINKEKGFFEIDNKLLATFEHIILHFPFEFKKETKTPNNVKELKKNENYFIDFENSKNRFINFALSHKTIYDIVNPDEELYIGTFIRNAKTTYEIYNSVFYKYLENLYTQSRFNEILLKYFLRSMKSNVPVEIFKNTITELDVMKNKLLSSDYSDQLKKDIDSLIVEKYNDYYKYSTNSLIELAKIKRNIIILNKDRLTETYEYTMKSLIFYHEALVYDYIFEQYIKDAKYKKNKQKDMKELKEHYETELVRISKEVQLEIINKKKYEENKLKKLKKNNSNNEYIENKEVSELNNNSKKNNLNAVLLKIKKLIQKNDILIPYNLHGKVYFYSLFNNSNSLNWNQNFNKNKHLILLGNSVKDIKNEEYRILKEEEFSKLKNMKEEDKLNYILDLVQNNDIYLENTELDNTGLFKKFIDNNCNGEDCEQILISLNQLKKIIHFKK